MVTAETAAVLPVLALLLTVALWSVSAVAAQLRCIDAAREAARAAARGEPAAQVRAAALQAGPAGATVSLALDQGRVSVQVSARSGLGPGWLPSVPVSGRAVAAVEPAAG
jgi:hypothetical protein